MILRDQTQVSIKLIVAACSNILSTVWSDMRSVLAALSEQTAAESRKCCAIATAARKQTTALRVTFGEKYDPKPVGGGSYIGAHFPEQDWRWSGIAKAATVL